MKGKPLVIACALWLAPIGAAWSAEGEPPAGDAAAGKAVAASCAACHGANGISAEAGIPHIAGQHASYIQGMLMAYKEGTRKDDRMHQAVTELSEQQMADVAAYYAGLTGFNSRPKAPGAASAAEADQDPFAAVRKLTGMCAGCHGEDGNSEAPATPSLAGQHDNYLIAAIEAYEDGTRAEPMMHALTQALARSQVEDIAYFYAAMIPRRFGAPAKGDALAGMAVAAPCASCHGVDGNSSDPKNPETRRSERRLSDRRHQCVQGRQPQA